MMSGTNEDALGDEDAVVVTGDADASEAGPSEAARFEQGEHAMTPDEAGIPSLAEVIAESGGIHEQVAGTMGGVADFPEEREGYPDNEND